MSAILITRREISVNAILDILDPVRRAKLDEITRLIAEIEPDPAIRIEVVDVERQISKKRLPRLPKMQRNVVRMIRPEQIHATRGSRDAAEKRVARAATQRAKEVLECFEGSEWLSLKDLVVMLGRSERHVRETMKMLHASGLFREEGRADELTHHMVPHYQVVKRRFSRLVSNLPDDVKVDLAERAAEAEEAAAPAADVVSTSELLAGAPGPADDLGLDLFDAAVPDIDADMADFPL